MAERAAKLQRIEAFRRKVPHVSASALTGILKEVRDNGVPDGGSLRKTFQEAREAVVRADGMYGAILREVELPPEKPGPDLRLVYADPVALLAKACETCVPFWTFFESRHAANPSTMANPWDLIIYSDEVTAGNVLAPDGVRKSQVLYYSLSLIHI